MVVGSQSDFTFAVGVKAKIQGLLRIGQQFAPTVQYRGLYMDKCPLDSVLGSDQPFPFCLCHLQREFLYPVTELEHFRLIRHAFFTESDKEPGDT